MTALSAARLWRSHAAVVSLAVSAALIAGCAAATGAGQHSAAATTMAHPAPAPYSGYLAAHDPVRHPLGLLGGPLEVQAKQTVGGVHVALPAKRKLDPAVFGTPDQPRAFGGTPMIDGLPVALRGTANGRFTNATRRSPFGDKAVVMGHGRLTMDLVDATATDTASTRDRVRFKASWQDSAGNTYEVRCCKKLAAHGAEYPTFGGVVTNDLMHGSSRVGTALMPTLFNYAAFWGIGQVLKNGQVVDAPRLVHVMLTEYVRTEGYALAMDDQVTPTRIHLHVMVPPFMPKRGGGFTPSPVKTGVTLPNGKPLPFWHVMFQNLEIRARRLDNGWTQFPQQQ